MISRETIDKIESAVRIEEVVGDFVSLKRAGKSYVGLCPFHNDKSPSMHVTPHLGIYKCFVCGAGGYATKFLMDHEKMSYPEALRYLAKKYNIDVEEDQPQTPREKLELDERDALFAVNEFAEKFFTSQLFDTEEGQTIGLSYFKERGFSEATIREFHLGYCPDSGSALVETAKKQGYSLERLEHLGLIKKSQKGTYFDFYRGRVIFPILSASGKPLGFGGRDLHYVKGVSKLGKYLNSSENTIYHKRDVLYGYFNAKKAIASERCVYVVEGYTDVISLHQAGVKNVVASSGTMMTDGHVRLISKLTNNVVAMFDGDDAGLGAALRGIEMFLSAGLRLRIVQLPAEHDPDSFARSCRDSELQSYLSENAVDFILFKAKMFLKQVGNDPQKRSEVVNAIVKDISLVDDVVLQSEYIRQCASIFNYKEEVLNVALRKLAWKNMKKASENAEAVPEPLTVNENATKPSSLTTLQTDTLSQAEEKLLTMMLRYGKYLVDVPDRYAPEPDYCVSRIDSYIVDELRAEDISLSVPTHQKFFEAYCQIAERAEDQKAIVLALVQHPDAEVQKFALDHVMDVEPDFSTQWAERFDVVVSTLNNHVGVLGNELINNVNMLKLRVLESFKNQLQLALSELPSDDTETMDNILRRLSQVDVRRRALCDLMNIVVTK